MHIVQWVAVRGGGHTALFSFFLSFSQTQGSRPARGVDTCESLYWSVTQSTQRQPPLSFSLVHKHMIVTVGGQDRQSTLKNSSHLWIVGCLSLCLILWTGVSGIPTHLFRYSILIKLNWTDTRLNARMMVHYHNYFSDLHDHWGLFHIASECLLAHADLRSVTMWHYQRCVSDVEAEVYISLLWAVPIKASGMMKYRFLDHSLDRRCSLA